MSKTPEEINAELMATAAAYNAQNPTGDTEEDAAAQAAARALEQSQGSVTHSGKTEVRADTPEEAAAAAEAKAKKEAEASAEAEKSKETKKEVDTGEGETAEAKAEREKNEAAAAEEAANADWMQTDSKEFNAAISLMKASGMTPTEAAELFDEAAQTGNLSTVDQKALAAKVGEDKAALIMAGFTRYVETEGAAILEKVAKVHETVGGSDNFATMSTWARNKAKGDPEFRKTVENITELMNTGNDFQAQLAAKEFLNLYNGDAKNSTITVGTSNTVDVHGAKAAPATPAVEPINARQYAEAVEEASKTLKGASLAQEMQRLSAARAKGRATGI